MGPTVMVYAPRPVDAATLNIVDQCLAETVDSMRRTRKGRVWIVWIDEHPFDVVLRSTSEILDESTTELRSREMHSNSATLRITINARLNSPADYKSLSRVARELAVRLDGWVTDPVK